MSENNVATVQIISKSSGWKNGITFVLFLLILAIVFFIGIGTGSAAKGLSGAIKPYETTIYKNGSTSKIAVLKVSGIIDSEQASWFEAAASDIAKDSTVQSVVLRVESGGGGVTASDQMWKAVQKIKNAGKPVVASFGSVAASGGYYIAAHADQIIVEPTTITGSIGVIAQIMTMENLMEMVGIKPVTLVATGSPEKDVANNLFRSWKDADKKKVMKMLDHSYKIFKQRVIDGRGNRIKNDNLSIACSGSIFMAPEAISLGVADSTGYLEDAIENAESLSGNTSKKYSVLIYGPSTNPFKEIVGINKESLNVNNIRRIAVELATPQPMFLMY